MVKLQVPPEERKIFTVSNFLSISRVLMLPLMIILLKKPITATNNIILASLIIIGIFTDFLDGYFARKFNEVSVLGKILDPVADKICIGIMVIFAVIYRDLPLWLAIFVIGRDVLIVFISIFVISKKEIVLMSNQIGKWTVFFLSLLIFSYLFNLTFAQLPLTILAIGSIVVSMISYGRRFISMLKT